MASISWVRFFWIGRRNGGRRRGRRIREEIGIVRIGIIGYNDFEAL